MTTEVLLNRRQIWAQTTTSISTQCLPFTLPSNGILTIDHTNIITLTQNAIFQPECTGDASSFSPASDSSVLDPRDPFYASLSPQIYAVAAATVISYMLFIMLIITPRTFFVGGAGGGNAYLGRRGMIRGARGSTSIVGVGGRPWLQKFATLTVAVSLTIATANTFRVAKEQYEQGFEDASALTDEVVGSLEIRIVRVISDTVLWLAQVQTLIRLFPRHKEKVVIEWVGFGLISLDTIFSIVNSFVDKSTRTRPRSFQDAIPALTYLFELALSLLYAAWVVYYSLEKRRFAFFHVKMRNICLVAFLSLAAVMIPVVFFVLDISKPTVAGWADYVRWVGAAAASVVVWEWVERIEALQRDELKEGVLGREIFDGDEMLEVTPSSEVNWPNERRDQGPNNGGLGSSNGTGGADRRGHAVRSRVSPRTMVKINDANKREFAGDGGVTRNGAVPQMSNPQHPTPPPPIASPVSRTDTASAVSTVYAVHYHSISASTSPSPEGPSSTSRQNDTLGRTQLERSEEVDSNRLPSHDTDSAIIPVPRWRTVANHFKRQRASTPREIAHATQSLEAGSVLQVNSQSLGASRQEPHSIFSILRTRKSHQVPDAALPIVVIPAQPRGSNRVWSPVIQDGTEEVDSESSQKPEPRPSSRYAIQDMGNNRLNENWIGSLNNSRLQSIPERQQETHASFPQERMVSSRAINMMSGYDQPEVFTPSENLSFSAQDGAHSQTDYPPQPSSGEGAIRPESCGTAVTHLDTARSNAHNPGDQENSWTDINRDPPRPP
ncbi:pH-response regulator protein palH/rim21 [Varicellaria rhodocarpa]|nr:pH-response regulator protein palH/rim21 [Varicellaria rhodocarpa]